ncbi:MAG TPA: FG-GAP-like repeat-containing protein [Candidatus Sulfotelmatobacter sp.]
MVPAGMRDFALRIGNFSDSPLATPPQYQLHPHYRSGRPLDGLLLKTASGSDEFIAEKYHDQIASILRNWSASLQQSPRATGVFEKFFDADFSGVSPNSEASRVLREGPPVIVRQMDFRSSVTLSKNEFLRQLAAYFAGFREFFAVEFQITQINVEPAIPSSGGLPREVNTRVRFEFVGNSEGFYREQRVGSWDLAWSGASGEFRLANWKPVSEKQCRSLAPVFADITRNVLGGNPSYSSQLNHGVDYWRTVLDGACGLDIYGHNGISVADIDNDGFDDLYVCQPAGLPNRLYRNLGDGTFEDITEASGVGLLDNTACALFADFDNQGRQDLIVVRAGGPLLFVNEGRGKFRLKPDAFQFAQAPQGTFTGAAVADYDRDGWLDVYFCLYVYYQGTDQYKYPAPYYAAENGPPNFMMRNHRDGTFRDVTEQSGLNQNNTRYSFCCAWADYDNDGWPDLYVVNDFGRKNLYHNNGDGTFTDVAAKAGVEDVGAGMSVCWFDYDNDGAQDLYVADMWTAAGERITAQNEFKRDSPQEIRALYRKHAMGNSLFRNSVGSGGEGFEDKSDMAGVRTGRWSWASDAWDFDHDGFPDLYIANGMISGPAASSGEDLNSFLWRQVVARSPDAGKASPEYEQGWNAINELIRADGTWSGFERNVFYANNRDGTFSDVSGAVGMDFVEDGRAFALADFDGDGRQEIFLKNRNGPQLRILKNVIEELPPSIAFRLRGIKSNRDAVGAVVTIETSSGSQTRTVQAGSGFLSQHSKQVFFGLGDREGPLRASIRWPSGLVQPLAGLPSNHTIWIEEGRQPTRIEPFRQRANGRAANFTTQSRPDDFPSVVETWLLSPVKALEFSLPDLSGRNWTLQALRGKPVLLYFWSIKTDDWKESLVALKTHYGGWSAKGLQLIAVNVDTQQGNATERMAGAQKLNFPVLRGSDDICAIYNLLYRYIFDRHRDMTLPTCFLIDANGEIVKIYQGDVDLGHIADDIERIAATPQQRMAKGLPFPGIDTTFEFGRNYLSFGSIFFQRGYLDQSAAFFRDALKEDPSSAEALYGIGSVYLSQEKTTEARTAFEAAVKAHAGYPETLPNAWNNLGLIAMREGRTDEGISYFQKALRLNSSHFVALENLGNAYRQQKRWDEARSALEKALAVNAADAEANYSLGMVFAQQDLPDRAYVFLRKALDLRPGYPEALNNLGVLYLRTQRRDDAVATFEECIRTAPDFDGSYLNLAQVYSLEGQQEKARNVLRKLLKRRPDDAKAQIALQQMSQ